MTPDPITGAFPLNGGCLDASFGYPENVVVPNFRFSGPSFATSTTLAFDNFGAGSVFLKPTLTFSFTVISGGSPVVYTATMKLIRACYSDAVYIGSFTLPANDCNGNPIANREALVFIGNHLTVFTLGGLAGWMGVILANGQQWNFMAAVVGGVYSSSGVMNGDDNAACFACPSPPWPAPTGPPCAGGLTPNGAIMAALNTDDSATPIPWSLT
jgi:hypothetical protein